MHPGAHNYTDKSMCTRELVIADAKWCSAYCPPATLLVQNFAPAPWWHTKNMVTKNMVASEKSMVVLGINMVPFERSMVALKKKIFYQKKIWWHQNEMATSWRTLSGRRSVPKCKECNDLSRGKNTKSFFVLWMRSNRMFCALRVHFVSLLCSNGTFCAFVLWSSLPPTVQSEEVIHKNVITGCLHVTYRDRTNR